MTSEMPARKIDENALEELEEIESLLDVVALALRGAASTSDGPGPSECQSICNIAQNANMRLFQFVRYHRGEAAGPGAGNGMAID